MLTLLVWPQTGSVQPHISLSIGGQLGPIPGQICLWAFKVILDQQVKDW